MPPRKKNTNVVTRYMIPIFLWSVVVTHSIQRLVWRGAVTSWAVTWGTVLTVGAVVTDMLSLLEVSCLAQIGPQLGHLRVRGMDILLELRDPLLVVARGQDVHLCGHERVLAAAQLRALAVVQRGAARLEPRVGGVAGHGVDLAPERRDPPGVDHIAGRDAEYDGHPRRHIHLLVGIRQLGPERVVLAGGP